MKKKNRICKATTRNGLPCLRPALIGDYCIMHYIQKKNQMEKNEPRRKIRKNAE
jgi:hypothetical protein